MSLPLLDNYAAGADCARAHFAQGNRTEFEHIWAIQGEWNDWCRGFIDEWNDLENRKEGL